MQERQETWVRTLGREDPWRRKRRPTPAFLTGKSHGQGSLDRYIQSMGSQRVRHDWSDSYTAQTGPGARPLSGDRLSSSDDKIYAVPTKGLLWGRPRPWGIISHCTSVPCASGLSGSSPQTLREGQLWRPVCSGVRSERHLGLKLLSAQDQVRAVTSQGVPSPTVKGRGAPSAGSLSWGVSSFLSLSPQP